MSGILLSIDLDGTLLNKNSLISDESAKVVGDFLKDSKNNIVLLNSGRPMLHMKLYQNSILDLLNKEEKKRLFVASDNGCWMYSSVFGDIYKDEMKREVANKLWEESIKKGFNPFLHSLERSYYGYDTPIIEGITKGHKLLISSQEFVKTSTLDNIKGNLEIQKFTVVEHLDEKKADVENFLKRKAKEHNLTYVSSEERFFMLVQGNATKLKPIEYCAKEYSIKEDDIYSFGDSDNDIPALEGTKNVIVPKSANKVIQRYATEIVGHHDEEGISNYIKKNLLSKNKNKIRL